MMVPGMLIFGLKEKIQRKIVDCEKWEVDSLVAAEFEVCLVLMEREKLPDRVYLQTTKSLGQDLEELDWSWISAVVLVDPSC
jgi:hypothetical protein